MNKKAALELSVNFLVIIIICIVVFASSIYIVRKFFTHAINIKDTYDERTEKEIERLLDDGSKVAVPFDKKTIGNGEFDSFGIGVMNMLNQGVDNNFQINIVFNKAYAKDNTLICDNPCNPPPNSNPSPNTWLKTTSGLGLADSGVSVTKTIRNNEQEKFLLLVEPKSAPSGTYIFNLDVYYKNETGDLNKYDSTHKLYVDVP